MKHLLSWIRIAPYWFPVGFLIIAAVSAYDTWLIIKFEECMPIMERNPIGQLLLQTTAGDVWLFVYVKAMGTVVVLSTLLAMWRFRYRSLIPVTTAIAWWQIGLLVYLTAA